MFQRGVEQLDDMSLAFTQELEIGCCKLGMNLRVGVEIERRKDLCQPTMGGGAVFFLAIGTK